MLGNIRTMFAKPRVEGPNVLAMLTLVPSTRVQHITYILADFKLLCDTVHYQITEFHRNIAPVMTN